MKRRTVIVTRAELLDDAAFEALLSRIKADLTSEPELAEVEFVLEEEAPG
jgi:sigma54-dependent transcription regulator